MGEKDEKEIKKAELIEVLHKKNATASLRSYQGDIAEAVKQKNESVLSINLKEKKRQDEERIVQPKKKVSGNSFLILFLGLFLIVASFYTVTFILGYFSSGPIKETEVNENIISFNNKITVSNVTKDSLGIELFKLPRGSGINEIKISGLDGRVLESGVDFLNFLEIEAPPALVRNLEPNYFVGVANFSNVYSPFLIFKVNDFGLAFSSMLEWEESMSRDLAFLYGADANTYLKEGFYWQDLIVKNKDTRAFINEDKSIIIAYTFLDKNTILITIEKNTISDISSIYSARSVAR
jgi:hypothetical protein